jgi:hypothetical protein
VSERTSTRVAGLTWAQVLAWRMSRQLLEPRGTATAREVARALCGVQVQVASSAELAVAVRQRRPRPGEVERALWTDRSLVKTWAMRGTLHLLPADIAGSYVATLSRLRPWEAKAWERYHGISPAEVDRVCEAIAAVLGSQPRTREELSTEIAEHVRSKKIAQKLGSGWSELLKPAAFQGLLCQGPPRDRNVTFVNPHAWISGWRLPDPDDAGADLVRWYLRAHGPATVQHFADWWARQRPSVVRPWFERLNDELVTVEIEGLRAFLSSRDLPAIRRRKPTDAVRLLPNFDQYVLASGRNDEAILPPKRKAKVSRQAGWISKVVILGGRIAGVWEFGNDDGAIEVELFEPVPAPALRREARHLGGFLGHDVAVRSRSARN